MLGSIVKAVLGGNASRKAASIQDQAAQRAADATERQFQQTREDLAPYRNVGTQASGRLADLLGLSSNNEAEGYGSLARGFTMQDFEAEPGYQFRFDEGMKALSRSQAARGGLFSGQAMKESMRFGQGMATDEYSKAFDRFNTNQGNLFNRLNALNTQGQNAAAQTGNFGASATENANSARMSGAAARAGGVVGNANAWIGGISEIENNVARAVNPFNWGTGLSRGPANGGRSGVDPRTGITWF